MSVNTIDFSDEYSEKYFNNLSDAGQARYYELIQEGYTDKQARAGLLAESKGATLGATALSYFPAEFASALQETTTSAVSTVTTAVTSTSKKVLIYGGVGLVCVLAIIYSPQIKGVLNAGK